MVKSALYQDRVFGSLELPHRQRLILRLLHNLPFSRPFVIDAAKVQDAVDDDAVQLPFVVIAGKLFGVGAYRIQADEEVAAQAVAFAVVESDDVRVVIVLKVLAVHFEDFLVRTEDVGYFADSLVRRWRQRL